MKLTQEHIGKKVRCDNWGENLKVIAISSSGDYCVVETPEKSCPLVERAIDNWEIVEEKKKPSERLKELGNINLISADDYTSELGRILDEMALDIQNNKKDA